MYIYVYMLYTYDVFINIYEYINIWYIERYMHMD